MRGGGGCGDSANEYSCAHGAQINFWDLTPYLTYVVLDHPSRRDEAESIEWFNEDQAFSLSYDLAPPPPPPFSPASKLDRRYTWRLWKRHNLVTGKGWKGWGRSQIIRRRERLVFYNSFNTHWDEAFNFYCGAWWMAIIRLIISLIRVQYTAQWVVLLWAKSIISTRIHRSWQWA
jgi:hypothetical protein